MREQHVLHNLFLTETELMKTVYKVRDKWMNNIMMECSRL